MIRGGAPRAPRRAFRFMTGPQLDSPQGYWIRLGDGSLQHLEHLLTEEDFAHQYPDAYAYARSVRDLDPALLEAD